MTCAFCPSDPCLATEGFDTPLCHDHWWLLGCPTIQPAIFAPIVPAEMFPRVTETRQSALGRLRHLLCVREITTSAAQLDWVDSRRATPREGHA